MKSINNIIILLIFLSCNLLQSEIIWADKVVEFSSEFSNKQFSANQILGKPRLQVNVGETPLAWRPSDESSLTGEYIIVSFPKKIKANYIYIHENYNAGAVVEIILFGENGSSDTVYKPKKFTYPEKSNRIFQYAIPGGAKFEIESLKLVLSTSRVPGFNEIEAVGISTKEENSKVTIRSMEDKNYNSKPINLGYNINSQYPELAPVINSKGNKIYFTRAYYPENIGYDKLQDVWFSEKVNGEFGEAKNIGSPINDENPNFAISVTQDGNSLIIGNVYHKDSPPTSGISRSNKINKTWSYPQELKINNYNKIGNLSSYCLASDGQTLLMAFEAEESIGGTDLWVSFLEEDGAFSEPKNLGLDLNSVDNENSPFLAADGKTLYFSSKGFAGFGSYDLFYSKRLDSTWQNWSEPINLGSQINSEGWDAYLTIPASGDYAYYVSTSNSIGAEDIFKIKLPESLKPEKVFLISGKVLSAKDGSPIVATIYYEDLKTGEQLGVAHSNEDGEYNIVLPSGEIYGFHAHADDFVGINENIDLSDNSIYKELERDLILVPIEKGQKIRLNNIFFDFADFNLLPNSFAELNRVVELMQNNPNLKIKIEGHTDDVGTQERNLKLSNKRANSVKEYLIKKGISEKRLETIGYGKSKPIDKTDSDEARKKNRRVEFTIIEN